MMLELFASHQATPRIANPKNGVLMNLQEQRFACLGLAIALGCKARSIMHLAREMKEYIEGPPYVPAVTVAVASTEKLDAVADCGTALAEPVLAPEVSAEAAPAEASDGAEAPAAAVE